MVAGAIGLTTMGLPARASAQQGRDALRRAGTAYLDVLFDDVIRYAGRGLDPQAGPRDSLWVASLHQLIEALQVQGEENLAQTWLRWAFRLEPNLPVDLQNFGPDVTDAFEAARGELQVESIEDPVRITWDWTSGTGSGTQGSIRINPSNAPITGQIQGLAILQPGEDRPVDPGTYTVSVAAEGFLPASIQTEVLPGVMTVLDFDLIPAQAGYLYVGARPWGEVFVDGERVGYTTLAAYRIGVGSHSLRIVRDGYIPFDTTITIRADERLRLGTVELRSREQR